MINILVVCIVLSSLLLVSCSSASNTPPTITFTKDGCEYSGRQSIPAAVTITLSVKDDSHDKYGYVVGILDDGKTIKDMTDWKSADAPSWYGHLGSPDNVGNSTSEKNFLLNANAAYQVDEVIFVCFIEDGGDTIKVGQVGPIKVKD